MCHGLWLLLLALATVSGLRLPIIRGPVMSAGYPLSVRNVVTRMTESTQRALQQRTTRMEVRQLPPPLSLLLALTAAGDVL